MPPGDEPGGFDVLGDGDERGRLVRCGQGLAQPASGFTIQASVRLASLVRKLAMQFFVDTQKKRLPRAAALYLISH